MFRYCGHSFQVIQFSFPGLSFSFFGKFGKRIRGDHLKKDAFERDRNIYIYGVGYFIFVDGPFKACADYASGAGSGCLLVGAGKSFYGHDLFLLPNYSISGRKVNITPCYNGF